MATNEEAQTPNDNGGVRLTELRFVRQRPSLGKRLLGLIFVVLTISLPLALIGLYECARHPGLIENAEQTNLRQANCNSALYNCTPVIHTSTFGDTGQPDCNLPIYECVDDLIEKLLERHF